MVDPRLRRFRGPIAAFAVMVALAMVTGAVIFARKIGLRPSAVEAFYLGIGGTGRARSLPGMLEVAVPHLLALPLVIFVTLHLVAFASRVRRRPFAVLSGLTFGLALVGIASGFAVRWIWPGLAPLKIAAFVGLEATLALWLGLLVAAIAPSRASPGPEERPEASRALPGAAR